MTSKPSVALAKLYVDLEYLGGISNNQKYCFGKRTYINNGWIATVYRLIENESQDVNGLSTMESIVTDAGEQYNHYKDDKTFGPKLLDSIVKARHGVFKCATTYRTLQKLTTASNIEVMIVFVLDNIIPDERKLSEGLDFKKRTLSEIKEDI
jgi:hypothetical protein